MKSYRSKTIGIQLAIQWEGHNTPEFFKFVESIRGECERIALHCDFTANHIDLVVNSCINKLRIGDWLLLYEGGSIRVISKTDFELQVRKITGGYEEIPVEITALQYTKDNRLGVLGLLSSCNNINRFTVNFYISENIKVVTDTDHDLPVEFGDWIIIKNGELYDVLDNQDFTIEYEEIR